MFCVLQLVAFVSNVTSTLIETLAEKFLCQSTLKSTPFYFYDCGVDRVVKSRNNYAKLCERCKMAYLDLVKHRKYTKVRAINNY